jgi:hypothetical protein
MQFRPTLFQFIIGGAAFFLILVPAMLVAFMLAASRRIDRRAYRPRLSNLRNSTDSQPGTSDILAEWLADKRSRLQVLRPGDLGIPEEPRRVRGPAPWDGDWE